MDRILLRHENDYAFHWRKGRRIAISFAKHRLEAASNNYNMFSRTYTLSGLFCKNVISELLEEVVQEGKEYVRKKTLLKQQPTIYMADEWGSWARYTGNSGKKFDKIYLKGKDDIIADLERFKGQEEIYVNLGVAFKRGYMLHGAPGNGKSSLAYAIAAHFNYDVYVLDLSNMTASNFAKAIKSIPPYSVLVIEDIDAFYEKRKPLGNNKITFSSFINAFSGVAQKSHIISIFTTNKLDNMDSALLRKGRCDKVIKVENPTKEIVEKFLSDIYKQPVSLNFEPNICFAALQEAVLTNVDSLENCIKILEASTTEKIEVNHILTDN